MTSRGNGTGGQPRDPQSAPVTGQVGAMGEEELTTRILAVCEASREHPLVVVGPGDDAAVVASPDARTVISTDLMVEGRHFRRDWSEPTDIGHRAAAANIADVAAMGARPTAVVIGLGIPADIDASWVESLMQGVVAQAERAGAAVVGGDVVAADRLVVSGTSLGNLEGREPILRSGARPGDVIAIAGRLGWAAAGLAVLSRGFRSPRVLVDAHRRPEPPYESALQAAEFGAHALMDVSDGLLLDLERMAQASGVCIDLDSTTIDIAEPVAAAAAAYNLDPLQWVLGGGDDHAFAAAFAPDGQIPVGWHVVGRVEAWEGSPGSGGLNPSGKAPRRVTVDGRPCDIPPGFTHFTR